LDIARPHKKPEILDFIDCDLTKDDSVRKAMETVRERHGNRIASFVHLAAYYDFTGEPSPLYKELTIEGTRRLVRELQGFDCEQFIFSSTLIVMKPAEEEEDVIDESSAVEPAWDYPKSKIATEKVIQEGKGAMKAVSLRIGGVYDKDTHTVPIAQQMSRIYEKTLESFLFPGDADHGQAFVHMDDLIDCVRKTIERRHELEPWEIFLIAEPDVMSYDELQETLGELIHGQEWPTIRIPKVVAKAGAWAQGKIAGDEAFIKPWMIELADDHYPVSIAYARRKLGWHPKKRLRTSLPEMVEQLKRDPYRWYTVNKLTPPDEARIPVLPEKADLNAAAPPWDYNPSAWSQRIPICILAGVAFLIATYMALYQWRLISDVWDPIWGDQSKHVLDSEVSESMRRWFLIPDAALGAIAYLGDMLFGLAGSTRRWQYRPWMVVLFGIDVIPLGIVSAVLVFLQGTVVGQWCFLCIVTAIISLVLVYWAYDEVWSTTTYLHRVWRKTQSPAVLWKVFWSQYSREADEVALVRGVP
ncbi:MAG: vitamin K epoxide reductase family protein, partial [Bryobacteraceae bacterium]